MSKRTGTFLAAVGLLFASGVVHHLLATDSEQLTIAAGRVREVPLVMGAWKGVDEPGEESAFVQAGASGYWTRTYTHQQSKASVLVILMCGRAGRMAVHTPEVCYRGAGFELHDQAATCSIKNEHDESAGQFWVAQFMKPTGSSMRLRLYWAWNGWGEWEAPSSARWRFRGAPYLYKLYVSRDLTNQASTTPEADPSAEFLREFVPVLRATLFSKS